jgi:predicted nucleic acid-binding Zn ribbon protein
VRCCGSRADADKAGPRRATAINTHSRQLRVANSAVCVDNPHARRLPLLQRQQNVAADFILCTLGCAPGNSVHELCRRQEWVGVARASSKLDERQARSQGPGGCTNLSRSPVEQPCRLHTKT